METKWFTIIYAATAFRTAFYNFTQSLAVSYQNGADNELSGMKKQRRKRMSESMIESFNKSLFGKEWKIGFQSILSCQSNAQTTESRIHVVSDWSMFLLPGRRRSLSKCTCLFSFHGTLWQVRSAGITLSNHPSHSSVSHRLCAYSGWIWVLLVCIRARFFHIRAPIR